MGSCNKGHVVCIPYPAQGHINPMLKLSKLLHSKGFHVTFVNTEYNHRRLLRSRGPHSLDGLPSFRFESIPDGLPQSDAEATQDIPALCVSTSSTCLAPFRDLLSRLNASSPAVPPVTCVVSDGCMSFTLDAAVDLGIPNVAFWTTSACGFLAYFHYHLLVQRGIVPLKDSKDITNGYLDETIIDWIPGMKEMRLRDFPSFVRTTDPNDIMLNFLIRESQRALRASAIVFNTYDALERDVLDAISALLPPVYTVGPLNLMVKGIEDEALKGMGSNLWKEEPRCVEWLEGKEPGSVVYVNFGSITVMTPDQLVEFAWGLAGSGKDFLWVIRPDLVVGEAAVLPPEFVTETEDRGLLVSWCSQVKVLEHPAVGGFLTHSGWNSTLESFTSGVPLISWPFFAEQQTNCRYSCREWAVGMEIEVVERGVIQDLVKELMEGEKGKVMRKNVSELKRLSHAASLGKGSPSDVNLDRMINDILCAPRPT